MSKRCKKLLLIHLAGVPAIFALYYTILAIFDITCPIKALLGKACPTCGMTRAMLSLLRFDIEGYVHYNPMALFMVVAVLLLIHRRWFKKKLLLDVYCAAVLVINTIYYVMTVWIP